MEQLGAARERWSDSLLTEGTVFTSSDCWQFTRHSVGYMLDSGLSWIEPEETELEKIVRFGDYLRSQNIDFVVAVVPNKTDVYLDKIAQEAVATSLANPQYHYAVHQLRNAGIEVVDGAESMKRSRADAVPLFLRTHDLLSPEGINILARRIAATIKGMSWYAQLQSVAYYKTESSRWNTNDLETCEAQIKCMSDSLRYSQITTQDGEPYRPNKAAPIVLSGQYTRLYEDMVAKNAGLPSLLAYELSCPNDWVILWTHNLEAYFDAIKKRMQAKRYAPKAVIFVVDVIALAGERVK